MPLPKDPIKKEEYKRKMSEALKGRTSPNKGKHFSEEWKRNISESHKGKKHYLYGKHTPEETKKKISETHKRLYKEGKLIAYFKGKHLSEETKRKLSLSHKGKIGYFKGKKFSEEHRKNLSESQKGEKHHLWGKHRSEETRKKMSESRKRLFEEGKITIWSKGKTLTEEHRQKISQSNKGKKRTQEAKIKISKSKKGKPSLNKGKKRTPFSEEWKRRLSESQRGKYISKEARKNISLAKIGEKNPMFGKSRELCPSWRGGISFDLYTPDFNKRFKEAIRERDNHCCLICNKSEEELGYKLSVHHIDYIKTNNFPQNCGSVCKPHHGDTNINRDHWKPFFQSLLKERYGYEYTQDQKIIFDFTKKGE